MSEHLVLGIAFFASVAILFKPAVKFLKGALLSYAKKIDREIEDSLSKKENVYEAMMIYLEKNKNLNTEAEKIIGDSRIRSEEAKVAFMQEMETMFNDKVDYVMHILSTNMQIALEEMRLNSVRIATEAVKRFIEESYAQDKDQQNEMCMNSISEFSRKKLH